MFLSGLTGDVDVTLNYDLSIDTEAPSVSLCCEFLDLTDHDPRRAGEVCLDICDKVSLAEPRHYTRRWKVFTVGSGKKVKQRLCIGVGAHVRPRLVVSMLKHFLQYAKRLRHCCNNGAPTSRNQ